VGSEMCIRDSTTVRHAQRTFSNSGISKSEPEISRPLLTTDEAMRLPADAALVFLSGAPTAWAGKLRYYKHPEFARRAQIPPPQASDRLRAAEPVEANSGNEADSSTATVRDDSPKSDSERLL